MMEDIEKLTKEDLVKVIGEKVIGTQSGLDAQHAQAELNKRLIDSIDGLNKSSQDYSRRLVALTGMLFVLALVQILVSSGAISNSWKEWVSFSAIVLYVLFFLTKYLLGK